MPHTDVVIVGGGIVGLATALNILESRPSLSVIILEKESEVAQHQTGHNSGVIHSGLYYKPGSLKASLCVAGYQRLLDFCAREDIAHEVCGKVVVAITTDQVAQLDELERRGAANGLVGLRRLTPGQIREREPHCAGVEGLFVPQTGIVDYTAVCESMRRRVEMLGGSVLFHQEVTSITEGTALVRVTTSADEFTANHVITCGGLHSDRLARHTVGDLDLRILPFRGEYFILRESARRLVRNLIYPVPNPAFPFLGVHFTRMIDGSVECGPNAVLAFAREGYQKTTFRTRDVMETLMWPGFRHVAAKYWRTGLGEYRRSLSKRAFVKALQALIPEVTGDDLIAAPAGVRAQACDSRGNLLDDFALRESQRVTHVCNAPSPAATASLAIGDYIATRVVSRL
ncbi:MAG: L-2-hydroxyglutarate oxidase [Actinomycetota bacterium]